MHGLRLRRIFFLSKTRETQEKASASEDTEMEQCVDPIATNSQRRGERCRAQALKRMMWSRAREAGSGAEASGGAGRGYLSPRGVSTETTDEEIEGENER